MKVMDSYELDQRIHSFLTRKFQEYPELVEEQADRKHLSIFVRLHNLFNV